VRFSPLIHRFLAFSFSVTSHCAAEPASKGASPNLQAPCLSFLEDAGIIPSGKNTPISPVQLLSARQEDFREKLFDSAIQLEIGSETFSKGLSMRANGQAVFQLNAPFKRFFAKVGVDRQSVPPDKSGSITFLVMVDGKEAARISDCKMEEPARTIDIPVLGARLIELRVSGAKGDTRIRADWADARLVDQEGNATYLVATEQKPGGNHLLQPQMPSSFIYGGQSSRILLKDWQKEDRVVPDRADRTVFETTWREPGGGFAATWRVVVFHDCPAMEFRWSFVNNGKVPTKILSQVDALDLSIFLPKHPLEIITSTGGLSGHLKMHFPSTAGFALSNFWTPLNTSQSSSGLVLSAADGRSSGKDLPFFVLHSRPAQEGLFFGIGWSGQWETEFDAPPSRDIRPTRIRAGMPSLNLALPPGERIISPSVLLGTYSGDWTKGSNLLRQTLYKKYLPLLSGAKPLAPVSWNSWFIFDNGISTSLLKTQADLAASAGVEYFCIDAGWFEGGFPAGVGNWTVDQKKFPNGLGEIGKYVANKGMKLGLWFEPERAEANTRLQREHPEWIHGGILDFGNPAAREWVFKMMKGYIEEAGVKWIRWDFNAKPLTAWKQMDSPDHQGLAQIRHIIGLYDVLDQLMKAYPDLLIEGCASGGLRIDLETVRRSHTFWKSDAMKDLGLLRFHETGGNMFLPGGMLNTNLQPKSIPSDLWSVFGGPLGFACDWSKLSADQVRQIRAQADLYKQLRGLLNEEYYTIFPQHRDESGWTGWQFHSRDRNEGFLVIMRGKDSPFPSALIGLKALDPKAIYSVAWFGGSMKGDREVSGQDLSSNWRVNLEDSEAAALMSYKKHE
jgi:alpha-galactosidase